MYAIRSYYAEPVPTSAPDEKPVDVQMPALGGPEAFVSIPRDIQLKTNIPRITSYNVCYTKLLRNLVGAGGGEG